MIQAHRSFLTQSRTIDDPKHARLIIVDSSPKPNAATAYYENEARRDGRIYYFHMPHRPGCFPCFDIDKAQKRFPLAYRWKKNRMFHDDYQQTIPSDAEILKRYKDNPLINETLREYDVRVYRTLCSFHSTGKEVTNLSMSQFNHSVEKLVKSGTIHFRPHLGSKRNFSYKVAQRLGAGAVVHLDDDWISPDYVESQLEALRTAHMTAKTHYPILIWTPDMREKNVPPLWGVSNLNHGGAGVIVDPDGTTRPCANTGFLPPMGFTHALRLWGEMPKVPDILGGEDRAYQKLVRDKHVFSPQSKFDSSVVRLAFGNSSSTNVVHKVLEGDDPRLIGIGNKEEIVSYMVGLCREMDNAPGRENNNGRSPPPNRRFEAAVS